MEADYDNKLVFRQTKIATHEEVNCLAISISMTLMATNSEDCFMGGVGRKLFIDSKKR